MNPQHARSRIILTHKTLFHCNSTVTAGDTLSANPLDIYKKFDPKVIECFENIQRSALSEGALPQKVKLLIAMAIDVEHGATQGATSLGQRAIKLGAAREEIIETFRIAYYVGGNRALFTSAIVLQSLFK
jgi:alkylhydroperoxidase/carboxymuconolactone decarboxylase family protein YurZ